MTHATTKTNQYDTCSDAANRCNPRESGGKRFVIKPKKEEGPKEQKKSTNSKQPVHDIQYIDHWMERQS
jgi:hypothetical protein